MNILETTEFPRSERVVSLTASTGYGYCNSIVDIGTVPDYLGSFLLASMETPTALPSGPPRLTRNTITENLTNHDAPFAQILPVWSYRQSVKQLIQIQCDLPKECRGKRGEGKSFPNSQEQLWFFAGVIVWIDILKGDRLSEMMELRSVVGRRQCFAPNNRKPEPHHIRETTRQQRFLPNSCRYTYLKWLQIISWLVSSTNIYFPEIWC